MLQRSTERQAEDIAGPDPIAAELASFAASTGNGDIPARVRSRALHHILDAIGTALAASRTDYAQAAVEGLGRLASPGAVPVIGLPHLWSPRDAATINGLLAHGLDFDDTHLEGVIHPTVSQFPAALSAAVMADATVGEMLSAYIIGVEAATRIASVAKGGLHRRGFHPTGVCNAPAAALTAGRLLRLEANGLRHAQGIALSMASGTLEFLEDGAWTKRLHPGWAAAAGITAASMADAGYVGASAPYSGRFGLYNAYIGEDAARDLDRARAGLGAEWELLKTAIKPYPACHLAHGCIDAALALNTAGIVPAEIASVTALVAENMVATICEPLENKRRPRSAYEAQFSIPFLVASALHKGRLTLAELSDESLCDPETLALAAKIDYRTDPTSGYPKHYSGEVIVTMRGGRKVSHRQQINTGAPEGPVTDAEIVAKFEGNAALVFDARRTDALRSLILSADSDRPARDWATELGTFH